MKHRNVHWFVVLILLCTSELWASVFGDVRGIVHDPQHRPIAGASIRLRSRSSDFSRTTQTNTDGEFLFRAVPIGQYLVTIESPGFNRIEQPLTVISDSAPVLHFQMVIAPLSQRVDVVANPEQTGTDAPGLITLVTREDVSRTPGADRTNSLAFITDFVPGSYKTHILLHVRGGHPVTWLVDCLLVHKSIYA